MQSPKISIIIRSKNEEKWIGSCLASVFRQDYNDFEVVLVDNCSTDRTLEKAASYPLTKVLQIDDFLPGKALNLGIRNTNGDYLVCLSAHCIPVNNQWLSKLLAGFDSPEVAGVYGRQEPMAFTDDLDKRDLVNIFGLDRKVQHKDPFFHNANSMIRRSVWDETPFSENATNIEDRIWAIEVLKQGYTIVYEPKASVYHYHGINQGRNVERARNVVRILEELHPCRPHTNAIETVTVTAIIPTRGHVKRVGKTSLLELAIDSMKNSRRINQIVVAYDNNEHRDIALECGAKVMMRPPEFSYDHIELIRVYQYVLEKLRDETSLPDLVFLAQEKYPFRPRSLVDAMVEQMVNSESDSVIAARSVYNSLWRGNNNSLLRLDEGFVPSRYKEPVLMALFGLGCLIQSGMVLQGKKMGEKAGLYLVDNPFSHITARSPSEMMMTAALLDQWRQFDHKEETCNEL